MKKLYRINIKTLDGKLLFFTTESYEIINRVFVKFFDEVKDQYKMFHVSNCEITYNRVGDVDEES